MTAIWFSKSFLAVLLNLYPRITRRLCFLPSAPLNPSLYRPLLLHGSISLLCFHYIASLFQIRSSLNFLRASPLCTLAIRPRLPAHRSDVPASWQRPRGAAANCPPRLLHQHPQRRGVHPGDARPECKRLSQLWSRLGVDGMFRSK